MTALILALIMVFSLAGTVLADETTTAVASTTATVTTEMSAEGNTISAEAMVSGDFSIKGLAGYKELLKLRAETQQIKFQIAHNQALIAQAIAASKKDHKDISAIVKTYRTEQKKLHNELKTLWKAQKPYWKELKAARHAKDKAKMEEAMNKILTGRRIINDKLLAVQALQDKLLVDLKNAPQKTVTTQTQTQVQTQTQTQNEVQINKPDKGHGLALGKVLREKIKNKDK